MKTPKERIVADGLSRIRRSESFAKRKEEIHKDLIKAREEEIDSAGWFRRHLILWEIDRVSTRKAEAELCPLGGLYLRSK